MGLEEGITSKSIPTNLMGNVADIFIGNNAAFAIKENGDVYSWGFNTLNNLGINTSERYIFTPTKSFITNISYLYSGNTTFYIKKDGTLNVLGANTYGLIGDGTLVPALTPKIVPGIYD